MSTLELPFATLTMAVIAWKAVSLIASLFDGSHVKTNQVDEEQFAKDNNSSKRRLKTSGLACLAYL